MAQAPIFSLKLNSLTRRAQRFGLSRGDDLQRLTKLRDDAVTRKFDWIRQFGRGSGWLAGYDPAGAGSPWYSIGPRNVNGRVKALAVHPTNPDIVYAGAASGGVWKSSDGGQTWDPLWDMQASLAIGALAIAANAPGTIYAGTGEWTPGWGPSYGGAGVFVSTDSGATWTQRTAIGSRYIGTLLVDPTNPQRVWSAGDAGLERTTDGGVTWTHLRNGSISSMALDPTNANTLLIAANGDGFYRSTDGGATFAALAGAPTGASLTWPQIAIGKSGAHGHNFIVIKYGDTVQSSTNGGATFSAVAGSHGGFYAGWCDVIACAPDDESILFWGGVGLDRTANGGTSWTSLPVHADQHAVVFAPSNSNIVYVGNDGGVWRSDDKGATIRKVSNGLVITQFYNISFWSPLSNVIGGGAQDNQTNWTTGGLTWQPTYGGDGGWFLIDPNDPRTMYCEYQNANIAKSTDGGQTWQAKTGGIVGQTPWEGVLCMDPNNHLRLFYGTDRVLRSNDALATDWTQSSQQLVGEVSAIAVARSNSNRVYAGTGSGKLYKSIDGGATQPWSDVSTGLPARPVTSIAVDASNADVVMLTLGGLSGGGSAQSIYRTTNGGAAWSDVSGDLPQVTGNAVAIDPSSAVTWYLATDTGIYRTVNSGGHWAPFDNGVPNAPVSDLAVDAARNTLYCGTMGRGAYKLDITPGVTKPQVDVYVRDSDLDIGSVFPSPSGLADPLQPTGDAYWWQSPDVKVNHAPVYAPGGVFDGVMFDTLLTHQDPWRGQSNRFYVQVANSGWKPTTNVSVRAFVADASAGLPPLPNALTPPAFKLSSTAHWTPVGPSQTIATLAVNRPAVLFWDFVLPLSSATHTCCLLVASTPDDPFNDPATDIAQLVTNNKRAALHNLHVVDAGPGPMPQQLIAIDFHRVSREGGAIEIAIFPSGFERGAVALMLPKIDKPVLRDAEIVPAPAGANFGEWHVPFGLVAKFPPILSSAKLPVEHEAIKAIRANLDKRLPELDLSRAFRFNPGRASTLSNVVLPAGGSMRGALVVSHKMDMPLLAPPRLDVVQYENGRVVGGSTFVFGAPPPTVHKPIGELLRGRSLVMDGVTPAD